MASVRTLHGSSGPYKALVQTYRWNGQVRQKEIYLGETIPRDLRPLEEELQQRIWKETLFPLFDRIREAYADRKGRAPPDVLAQEAQEFLIRFTFSTNRIEGSSLTLEETRSVVEDSQVPKSKPIGDVIESKRHADLLRRLISKPEPIDFPHLLAWHKWLFAETKPTLAGRLRDYPVRIGESSHIPPSPPEVRPMLIELLRWTHRASGNVHPVAVAGEFHQRFESIHPFGDGNGRVGRLALNVLLARADYPMLNIQYGRRQSYYDALERADTARSPRPFLRWFFLRYAREHAYLLPRSASQQGSGK